MNLYQDTSIARSQLEAATAAFLMSGKTVERLKGVEFKPLPKRIEPQISPEERERRALAARVREMAKTMTRPEIEKAICLTSNGLTKLCQEFGIKPKSGAGRNPNSRSSARIDPESDRIMAEKIRALTEAGMNKTKMVDHLSIGPIRLNRIIDEYEIFRSAPAS